MFSRTQIAKEFRKWVLDILDKETSKEVIIKPQEESLEDQIKSSFIELQKSAVKLIRQTRERIDSVRYTTGGSVKYDIESVNNSVAIFESLKRIVGV